MTQQALRKLIRAIESLDNEEFDFTPHMKIVARESLPHLKALLGEQREAQGAWQPIESAPHDARCIVALTEDGPKLIHWHPVDQAWCLCDNPWSRLEYKPTHWIRLPNMDCVAPPLAEKPKHED